MIRQTCLMTPLELKAIDRKLKNKKLTQQESNRLSKQVRPKLREMMSVDSERILKLLDYNQKIPSIEREIKRIVLKEIKNVSSIVVYGSSVYNNYKNNEDIDVMVLVKKKTWKKLGEKLAIANEIMKKSKLKLDLKIYEEAEVVESYPNNITLIYELSDSKIIYGSLALPKKNVIEIDLRMKTDESRNILWEIEEGELNARNIYGAMRNLVIVELMSKGIVSNDEMNKKIEEEIGRKTVEQLKSGKCAAAYKRIGELHLREMLKRIDKWGKRRT